MRAIVEVRVQWESHHEFEFENEEEAETFRETVNQGGDVGINAIIENGDVTSEVASLTDWVAL